MSKARKTIVSILCAAFTALLAMACVMLGINNRRVSAAEIGAEDFKITKIGIRLADDGKQGVRFTVRIKKDVLEYQNAKVTVYVLPQMFYNTGAHLTEGAATVIAQELTDYWTDETSADGSATGYATSAAYIYDIPTSNYGVKLLAEAALTYTENGTTHTEWTAITEAYSLTDVAKQVASDKEEEAKAYIVDTAKITYKNADGTIISGETLAYGANLNYPEVAQTEGKTLRGWFTAKNTYWNAEWVAQGNMSLFADCATETVIDDCAFGKEKGVDESGFNLDTEIQAPGFEKVYSREISAASWQSELSHVNISAYKEVRFAVKTTEIVQSDKFAEANAEYDRFANAGWLTFFLTNLGGHNWNVKILGTSYNYDRNIIDTQFNANGECLCNVLYHGTGGWGLGFISSSGEAKTFTIYTTELRGCREVSGEIVSESALKDGQYSLTTDVSVPGGYEEVWESTLGADTAFYGSNYSQTDLSYCSEVHFALKISEGQSFRMYELGYKSSADYSDWLYFSLVRNTDETWAMTVECNGNVVYTKSDLSGTPKDSAKYASQSLAAILYGGDPVYFPKGATGVESKFYFTEIRGTRKIVGEKIIDCVYGDASCSATKTAVFTDSSEAVPGGYTIVKEYTCPGTELKGGLSHFDISGYEEVYFAIKSSGYMSIDTNANPGNPLQQKYDDWLYFTLLNESTDNKIQWHVKVTYRGKEIVNFSNTRNISSCSVCGIIYHCEAVGTKHYNDTANFKIYATELRGVKKVETQSVLAKAGATDYKIVVPDKSVNETNYGAATRAASELKTFFKEATGADLGSYIQDTGNLQAGMKYISIGFTNTLNSSVKGVDYDALGISGFSIQTVNGNVYISGQSAGLMNGVYEFLRRHFNYEYYTDGFYKIDDCSDEKVVLQAITEEVVPSFEYRLPAYGFEMSGVGATDSMVGWRMQYNNLSIKGVGGVQWHNFFAAISPAEYQTAHPDWFSPEGTQPCLTRDRNGLAEEMAKKVQEILQNSTSANFVMIGQQDNDDWCTCSSCKEVIAQYGGVNSATYILFMNAVSDKLQPYLERTGRTDVKLGMFAYHKTQDAPVAAKDGKITLTDGMKLNSNICVVYAPIEANYYVSFNDEVNASVKRNIAGWGLAADNVLYWTYMENFGYYQLIFDNFGSMQENLQLLHENNGVWLYNLAQYNNVNSTGFSRYKAYLNAKLMWNVDADVEALTDDFFNHYFGVAATDMKKVFNEYRAMTKYIYENEDNTIGYLSLNGHTPSAKDFWFSNLKTWMSDINNALAKAETLQGTDEAECERVKKAVKLESLSMRYTMITYFGGNFSAAELSEMKQSWKNDAAELNVTMCGEHKTLETLYSEWGI